MNVPLDGVFLFLHVTGIILWLGPSIAGFYFLVAALRERDPERVLWVHDKFQFLINLEHIGLGLLLLGAVGMLVVRGWSPIQFPWLAAKVILFLVFIAP